VMQCLVDAEKNTLQLAQVGFMVGIYIYTYIYNIIYLRR
jgi:hypothetical protein